MNRAIAIRILCAVVAVLGCSGFRSFLNHGSGHDELTRRALMQVRAHRVLTTGFQSHVPIWIGPVSEGPDQIWHAYAEEEHFDNESFENTATRPGAPQKIANDREEVLRLVRAGHSYVAWRVLGSALHTIADFYSHSSWVEEKSGVATHGNLAKFMSEIGSGGPEASCDADARLTPGGRITSAYFELVHDDPNPPFLVRGVPKCVHGGLTNWRGVGFDRDDPSSPRHQAAADRAVVAMREFVQGIVDELEDTRALSDEKAVCVFLGESVDLCVREAAGAIDVWRLNSLNIIVTKGAAFTSFHHSPGGEETHNATQGGSAGVSAGSSIICHEGSLWLPKTRTVVDNEDELLKWSLDAAGNIEATHDHKHASDTPQRAIESVRHSHLKMNLGYVGPYSGESSYYFSDEDKVNGTRYVDSNSSNIPERTERSDNNTQIAMIEKIRTLPEGSPMPRECF